MAIDPEYEETHKELQKIIENPPELSVDQQIDTVKDLGKKVEAPESKQAILREIRTLAQASLEVDTSFLNVAAILVKIRVGGTTPELRADITRLIGSWDGYQTEFSQLLWKSREVAGLARAAAEDFRTDFVSFLTNEDVTVKEKQDEIITYIVKLERDAEGAKGMSQGFTTLQKSIELFHVEWTALVKKHDLDDYAKKIEDLDANIKTLESTLTDLRNKIKALGIAIGVLSTAVGASSALGFLVPAFWIGTIVGVVGVAVSSALLAKVVLEEKALDDSLLRDHRDRDEYQATLDAVKELKAGLTATQDDFNIILTRLGAFAHVWAVLRADLQAISEALEFAQGTKAKILLQARLTTSATLYEALSEALYEYQVAVPSSHAVFGKIATSK